MVNVQASLGLPSHMQERFGTVVAVSEQSDSGGNTRSLFDPTTGTYEPVDTPSLSLPDYTRLPRRERSDYSSSNRSGECYACARTGHNFNACPLLCNMIREGVLIYDGEEKAYKIGWLDSSLGRAGSRVPGNVITTARAKGDSCIYHILKWMYDNCGRLKGEVSNSTVPVCGKV